MNLSIVVPVYNGELFIEECLESIAFQIDEFVEVVVVNDGSVDSTELILNNLKKKYSWLKVFHRANFGRSSARNFGVLNSLGEYIHFLDADDVLKSGFIKRIKIEISGGLWDFLVARMEIVDEKLTFIEKGPINDPVVDNIKKAKIPNTSCITIRKVFFEKLGGFSEDIEEREDWELALKAVNESGTFLSVNGEAFVQIRKHGSNKSDAHERFLKYTNEVYYRHKSLVGLKGFESCLRQYSGRRVNCESLQNFFRIIKFEFNSTPLSFLHPSILITILTILSKSVLMMIGVLK